MNVVTLTINGRLVSARQDETILHAGRSAGISIPLRDEPERHPVDLLSLPDGAELAIDGQPAGRTNVLGLQLTPGFHVIALRRRGFLPWLQEIEVPSGAGRVIATLQGASGEQRAAAR